jgi:myo-inositol-1(or 4)-monophosphatase
MHPMLNTAVKAARKAGSIINRASLDLDLIKVAAKGRSDFVTEVDRAAEAAIIDVLKQAYPSHAILAEESGASHPGVDSEYTWIIDPLDGTTNFIHGFPQYAVSIGLQHNGLITQGVVYDPTRNELFTATRGRGAYLNDRRIRVSRRTKLSESLIGTGFPVPQARAPRRLRAHVQAHHRSHRRHPPPRAPPRSISPTWPAAGSTASGSSACQRGTWRPAAC